MGVGEFLMEENIPSRPSQSWVNRTNCDPYILNIKRDCNVKTSESQKGVRCLLKIALEMY